MQQSANAHQWIAITTGYHRGYIYGILVIHREANHLGVVFFYGRQPYPEPYPYPYPQLISGLTNVKADHFKEQPYPYPYPRLC